MVGGIAAAELDDMDIPALSWTVPGLVPRGFGIVAAAPKLGKSWLVLSLGLAVASGTSFLGVLVEQRPVLYLALEDGQRRLQERQRRILDGSRRRPWSCGPMRWTFRGRRSGSPRTMRARTR
jgi:RecA-family ATPase